jgi:sortase (surface protein transpeptidase)
MAVAGAAMTVAGAALLWHGLTPGPVASSLAPPPAAAAPAATAMAPGPLAGAIVKPITRTIPDRVVIPAIGVDAVVKPTGTDATGALAMPPLTAQNLAVWWDGGAAPGQDGPAVIAGHVDSAAAPLVFWRLREIHLGDKITVDPAGVTFTVTRVTQVDKSSFPTSEVYGATKDPELRLVTCGGTFDTATGHYLSNIIVYAHEVKS